MSARPQSHTNQSINPPASMTSPAENETYLSAVQDDLRQLETEYAQYLEQESLHSDVQCLHKWIASYKLGDKEAVEYLHEHGAALLSNIKDKLKTAAREMQRIDEESPVGGNFSGGKADRLNNAAATAIHAEDQLSKALNDVPTMSESPIVAK